MRKLKHKQTLMDISEKEAQILLDEGVAYECKRQGRAYMLQLYPGLRWNGVKHLLPGYG